MVNLAISTHTGVDFWMDCSPADLLEFALEVQAAMPGEGQ